jgi:catechol 2,3-dioxygenase-like lactoylglutathione lyase family enzyme
MSGLFFYVNDIYKNALYMKNKNRLFQIAMSVMDINKTKKFYDDILGFTLFKKPKKLKGMVPARIQGYKKVNALIAWMNCANPSFQLEFFQYFNPQARPMHPGARPYDTGYSRMGLRIADFDAALGRLEKSGVPLLTEPKIFGEGRRVGVRDPDGVYLELMEKSVFTEKRSRPDVLVSVQYITLSVPDIKQAENFYIDVLGFEKSDSVIHTPEMESLWGLAGAKTKTSVLKSGDILFELVEYQNPRGRLMPEDRHIGDAGLWHIAVLFGRRKDFMECYRNALAAGHSAYSKPVSFGFMNFVYMKSSQGFTVEFAHFPEWMGRFLGI